MVESGTSASRAAIAHPWRSPFAHAWGPTIPALFISVSMCRDAVLRPIGHRRRVARRVSEWLAPRFPASFTSARLGMVRAKGATHLPPFRIVVLTPPPAPVTSPMPVTQRGILSPVTRSCSVPNSTRALAGPANGCMSMPPLASGPAPSSRLRALRTLLSSSAVLDAPATATSPGLGAGVC